MTLGLMTLPLVLAPETKHDLLARLLEELGYHRDTSVQAFTPDMIVGEPELAAWVDSSGARLTYTFNPVVHLRVLTPTAVDEAAYQRLGQRLPILGTTAMARLLSGHDKRGLLLGLTAVRLSQARALLGAVSALLAHPDPTIAQTARSTYDALVEGGEASARNDALRLLRVLCEQAVDAVAQLVGPNGDAAIQQLRPQPEDYTRVFVPDAAPAMAAGYAAFWQNPPRLPTRPPQTVIHVDACPAGMLAGQNELSLEFPGGYHALAPHLQPNRIWFVWRYVSPARDTMRYDGLVRLDERWLWFPKPYRVFGERRVNLH